MIITAGRPTVSIFPEQTLKADEIEEMYGSEDVWYTECIRYIAGRYNQPVFTNDGTTSKPSEDRWGYSNSPVQEMWENNRYFHALQDNSRYSFWFEDPFVNQGIVYSNNDASIRVPDEKGNQIYNLITHLVGTFAGRIQLSSLTVENNSRQGRSKKEAERRKAFLFEILRRRGVLDRLANAGVNVNPFPMMANAEIEQILEYIENFPQEVEMFKIMRDIIYRNNTVSLISEGFLNAIINRVAAIYIYTDDDGMVKHHSISPYNVVIDQRGSNDFSLDDRYAGFIQFLTPGEIFERFDITDEEERERIHQMSKGAGFEGASELLGQDRYRFPWWWKEQGTVACFTAFWKSYMHKNKISTQVVRKGTLIGNCILKGHGLEKNIVKNPYNKKECVLPIMSVRPYTLNGYNRSLVDRLKQLQDKIDVYNRKIAEAISHDLGNAYIFHADNMGSSIDEIVSDIKKHRMTVIQRTTGEELLPEEAHRVAEKLDFNISPNVQYYLSLKQETKREMEEVASTSAIAMGQQQSYIGLNTQMNTIAQNAKGVEHYFSSCLKWYADVMQYSVEKFKLSCIGNKKLQREVLDDNGIQYIELNKDVSFMELGVKIAVEGVIDEQRKTRLVAFATALAQAGGIDMLDFIRIEKANTLREIEVYFTAALRNREKKKAMEMAMQQMAQQANIQAQNQGLQQLQAQKEANENLRQDKKLAMEGTKLGVDIAEKTEQQ